MLFGSECWTLICTPTVIQVALWGVSSTLVKCIGIAACCNSSPSKENCSIGSCVIVFCFLHLLQSWSFKEQEKELKLRAPNFLKALQAAAISDSMVRAKTKSEETIRPAVMTSAGTLLQARNKNMIAQATGLQLDVGNASKLTQMRLQSRCLSIASSTIKTKQVQLGVGFDEQVVQWKKQIESETTEISKLQQSLHKVESVINDNMHTFSDTLNRNRLQEQLGQAKLNRHPGYKLVGDNIDFSISPRYWTREEGRKSIHYFNFLAIENRVSLRVLSV